MLSLEPIKYKIYSTDMVGIFSNIKAMQCERDISTSKI
jgi:hypothetical protein